MTLLLNQMERIKRPPERNILKNCHICRKSVLVDEFGNGECEHCGWRQSRDDGEHPDRVIYPNLVSYDRAKQLVHDGKPLNPQFEDFIEGFLYYGEMQFNYKSKTYGLVRPGGEIEFYEWNILKGFQTYKTIEDFIEKSNINGALLKDIWHEIEKPDYM